MLTCSCDIMTHQIATAHHFQKLIALTGLTLQQKAVLFEAIVSTPDEIWGFQTPYLKTIEANLYGVKVMCDEGHTYYS